ncbi:hypothetical protein DYB31_009048 [Aphanomyces astaci]|uniref:N-acetyltransferase domain-containing protein n=1 Tax=Aphanomyces astaci TaxID=112090 RepID=A0A397F0R6_APHAT|nr:hypothetical protein DYB31_009048 [Aphanomyces astaci]
MIEAIRDPQSFLTLTLSLRRLDPIGSSQIAAIASDIAYGVRSPDGVRFFVASATSLERGVVVTSFAMHSSGRGLLLSPTVSMEEATELGEIFANTVELLLVQVMGNDSATAAFNASYCRHRSSPTTSAWKEDLIMYVLGNLQPPSPSKVAGAMRSASIGRDADLLTAWSMQFLEYIQAPTDDAAPFVARGFKRHALFVWEVDGNPVGFAGYASPVTVEGETVFKIGPVFVAPSERRQGYASALTAALCRHLLESNILPTAARICLFANAANPASNKAYQNVGFELHSRRVAYSLESATPSI